MPSAEPKKTTQPTPEKKLLEIIESDPKASGTTVKSDVVKTLKKSSAFSIGDILPKLKGVLSVNSLFSMDFKKLNKVLMFVSFGMVFYMGVFFVNSNKVAHRPIDLSLKDSEKSSFKSQMQDKDLLGSQTDFLTLVMNKVRSRDLFKPYDPTKDNPGVDSGYGREMDALRNIKLVGVSVSVNPQESYVMLEDTTSKSTFFLKKDENIQGLKIVSILPDKVILGAGDKQLELR